MQLLPWVLSVCVIASEELVENGNDISPESIGVRILFAILGYVLPWLALIITGSIFDRLNEGEPATLWENAQAALVIIGCTALINILSIFLPIPPIVSLITYWGLIYFAFQLDNIMELIFFMFAHGFMLFIINLIVTLPMLKSY